MKVRITNMCKENHLDMTTVFIDNNDILNIHDNIFLAPEQQREVNIIDDPQTCLSIRLITEVEVREKTENA